MKPLRSKLSLHLLKYRVCSSRWFRSLLQVDLRTPIATKLFKCYPNNITRTHVKLYDIAMDPSRLSYHLAAAGSDNYARVYDIRGCNRDGPNDYVEPVHRFCPSHLIANNNAKIGALSFTEQSELLVSYLCENIYLFLNDTAPQVYRGHENSVHSNSLNLFTQGMNSFGPNSDFVASGSDCGRIFIWKKNGGDLKRVLDSGSNKVNCIECHPQSMVLASTGQGSCVKIWQPDVTKRGVHPVTILKRTKPSRRNLERDDIE